MKKLVVSLAVVGLVGVAPASAHEQAKLECSFDVLRVSGQASEGQTVRLKVWLKNTSSHTMESPEMKLLIEHANEDGTSKVLGRTKYAPSNVKAGQEVKDTFTVKARPGKVTNAALDHCHA